jgi:hypothetical protein
VEITQVVLAENHVLIDGKHRLKLLDVLSIQRSKYGLGSLFGDRKATTVEYVTLTRKSINILKCTM